MVATRNSSARVSLFLATLALAAFASTSALAADARIGKLFMNEGTCSASVVSG